VTSPIAVLGAGSWGSTLAGLLAAAGKHVRLWTRNPEKALTIEHDLRFNKSLLPHDLMVTSDLPLALKESEVILLCPNSQAMRDLCQVLGAYFDSANPKKKPILVSTAKGLELQSLKRMSEVILEVLPEFPVCALSGPNLAGEILSGLPTAAVVASQELTTAASVQQALSVAKFRVYSNTDIVGVELGGTLKNVIAIAAGGSDGLNLGVNAKAALLTRGLAEMTRLSVYLGAKGSTLAGLAGMGDLFATCAGPLSRNYRLGLEMARGKSIEQVRQEVGSVIEGVPTTAAVCELSKRLGVELPIADLVQSTLLGETTPAKAIMALMARPLASE
jgi:glycerol-3-phosphate dehydrogenase (NAD(P)+)